MANLHRKRVPRRARIIKFRGAAVASRVAFSPHAAKISEVLGKRVPGISTSNGPGGGVANVRYVDQGRAEIGWRYGDTADNGYPTMIGHPGWL